MRQSFLSSTLWVWEKYWNPISSRIIERPHRRFVLASLSGAKNFWKLILSNFVKIIFVNMFPLEYSSSIIHFSINILMQNIWNCKTREFCKTIELRLNFSTLQNVYDCLRNFGVSAPVMAAALGRRPACRTATLFVFKACKALRRSDLPTQLK